MATPKSSTLYEHVTYYKFHSIVDDGLPWIGANTRLRNIYLDNKLSKQTLIAAMYIAKQLQSLKPLL